MELILAALIAGATAATKDTAGVAVKDAYEGLKALIKKKFEKDALAQAMVDAKPEDIKQAEGLLKAKMTEVGIDKDAEILKAAAEILKKEDPQGAKESKYSINAQGDIKGIVGDVIGGEINQTIN
jgi:disulfide oxidoreductase YuzD